MILALSLSQVGALPAALLALWLAPATFRAAHIVKHVNEHQSEQQAEAGIRIARAELERGEPFADFADRHSDCKGNGGDLGEFPAGKMVDEFDRAIAALDPGQRTGISKHSSSRSPMRCFESSASRLYLGPSSRDAGLGKRAISRFQSAEPGTAPSSESISASTSTSSSSS